MSSIGVFHGPDPTLCIYQTRVVKNIRPYLEFHFKYAYGYVFDVFKIPHSMEIYLSVYSSQFDIKKGKFT